MPYKKLLFTLSLTRLYSWKSSVMKTVFSEVATGVLKKIRQGVLKNFAISLAISRSSKEAIVLECL